MVLQVNGYKKQKQTALINDKRQLPSNRSQLDDEQEDQIFI